ncbi:hypothetical protein IQ35_01109 [Sphingobium wenxiniae]|uniref:Uncharacterized protein n=1 Tax=Sphingobium wenxiniae (strain DSM 21828 / CGMCC 1.7748 / JZ-1) TaxID=595605 RepID=A0A562KKT5_SPHWJ|nr:hypothetical protein IQ35_01109 [Sphingobium wenxiniae]
MIDIDRLRAEANGPEQEQVRVTRRYLAQLVKLLDAAAITRAEARTALLDLQPSRPTR